MNFIKEVKHYKLLEEISKEKDFITYLGIDNRNDKLVSIKEISKIDENEDFSLKNQLKILIELKHVNITRLKDIAKTKKNYFIISEYCNGGKLSDLLKYYHDTNKSQLNEIYIQKIIRQVSSGLHFIHY